MTPTPTPTPLLQSRRFWLLLLDTVISVTLYFVGQYGTPKLADDIKFLIVTIQPVFVTLIAAYTIENQAVISATSKQQ